MDDLLQFLREFREAVFLILGALIGFLSSVAMWRRQVREQRRSKRAEYILRSVHLASSSLTYARALMYSKINGVTGVLSLPPNPVDELMAIAGLHLPEICSLVQQLHEKQQILFGSFDHEEDKAQAMLDLLQEFPPIVNQLVKQLGQMSDANEKA